MVLELLIAHSTLVVLLSRMFFYKKRMDMFAYNPVNLKSLETLAKTFISLAKQKQVRSKKIS